MYEINEEGKNSIITHTFHKHSPWAILPDKLLELIEMSRTSVVSTKIKEEPIASKQGKVGVINIRGALLQSASALEKAWFGLTTYDDIESSLLTLLKDKDIDCIVLNIDSPGGNAQGVQEISDLIFNSRGIKPIVSYTNGLMASAAYWIGSSASKIYISSDTVSVGSIGVVMLHQDVSKALEKFGVTITELTAGKYKRMLSNFKPLTDEGKEYAQEMLDHMYSVFVNAVARNRGVTSEKVLSTMADGKIFIGKNTIDKGLTDGLLNFGDLVKNKNILEKVEYTQGGSIVDKITLEQFRLSNSTELEAYEKSLIEKVTKEMQSKFALEKTQLEMSAKDTIAQLSAQFEDASKRLVLMEKQELARRGREIQMTADQIWAVKLADSELPKEAWNKAKTQVDLKSYVKDGQLDSEAFSKAIDTELQSWAFLPKMDRVMGLGVAVQDVNARQKKEDEALIEQLYQLSGVSDFGKKEAN